MNTRHLVAMLAMAGASLCAGQSTAGHAATVTVCSESDPYALKSVRQLASRMFASIGVRIDWREPDSCPAGVGTIRVRLSYDPPGASKFHPLAFAQPDKGTIVVFPHRVQNEDSNGGPSLMAHALVHEITHVLEGISRHSATGIMKARWDANDYFEMRCQPLGFAQEDIDLIYAGLKAQQASAAAASAVTAAASLVAVAGQ